MAQDYEVASFAPVHPASGYLAVQNVSTTIGSSDTDDGTWDLGDRFLESSTNRLFDGFYEDASGNLFLVFVNSSGDITELVSPNSTGAYPTHVDDIPAYTRSQLALCFLAGTRITVPGGERRVESLRIGDRLSTQDGQTAKVKWIGRQTVMTRFGPAERLMPVRFAAGSLGEGLPHTDLTVTADHGMLVDGVICHAGALVNGETITRVPLAEMGETYTVYHIETEAHEIILANGAPAETFIDNVSRQVFDNFAEFEALYGEVPEMEELPYARAMSARQVPGSIRRRLGICEAA
ncbi:Hint domain-containing protein [Nioella sediminis]|jgi:hypothetical protein|uniref:Hint domain-containing protein n=1 Tax=Nioella sediminis TaxID=1912092 RepID=UPI0008FD50F3|nr:Hint domain-containing protein [Nioella sediminis]